MPRQMTYAAGEAARLLGISLDTLRRWDRAGKITTIRDQANRRVVPASEVERLRARQPGDLSARNRFTGTVTKIEIEGLLAQVEMQISEPARVVAVITREAAAALGLRQGMQAQAVVKATSVMVQR